MLLIAAIALATHLPSSAQPIRSEIPEQLPGHEHTANREERPSSREGIKSGEHQHNINRATLEDEILRAEPGVPLIIDGQEIFRIYTNLGPFSASHRVSNVQAVVRRIEIDRQLQEQIGAITTQETDYGTYIKIGDLPIMMVTSADAKAAGEVDRQMLAKKYATALKAAIADDIKQRSLKNTTISIGLSALATAILVLLVIFINEILKRLSRLLVYWKGKYIKPLKIQNAELLSAEFITDLFIAILGLMRLFSALLLFGVYAAYVLGLFPDTKPLSAKLIGCLVSPFQDLVYTAIVPYLPNVLISVAILVSANYAITFVHFLFKEVGRGTITLSGFDPDWSEATFKIVRFLIICFAFVLIFPYLPGSGSPAFQQISIFIGVLISLGSTGAMGHIVAGICLTYTGAFRIGDRVKIADTEGDVVQTTLLATRIRTIKHEYITVPNGLVLGSHIINYSSSARGVGLILHTQVTIGYDAPWQKVHQLLIESAQSTGNVLADPAPFVLQLALNNCSVSYQINAYTNTPEVMAETYSNLYKNIQDRFNEAGIEIMTPNYSSLRDGNRRAAPSEYLPETYQPPGFLVHVEH